MEKWNYILREEIGGKGKEGRRVFLADRIPVEPMGEEETGGDIRQVVIKSTDCSSGYLRASLMEYNCLQKLQHPGIPQVLELCRVGRTYHLILTYIEGESLQAKLEKGWHPTLSELCAFLQKLGGILSYLHSQKPPVLYCDLKPEHIMLDRDGQIHLLDFDGVTTGETERERGGNYRFSAPEQWKAGESMDPRSDLYSFGRIAELLFSNIPEDILMERERRQWKRFLKRCTEETPEKRYRDMETALKKLQKLASGQQDAGRG